MEGFYNGIFEIFLPCAVSAVVIGYAIWVNQMLCCVTGCFKAPPSKGAAKPPPTMEMTSIETASAANDLTAP